MSECRHKLKSDLVNIVSGGLFAEPRFDKGSDPKAIEIASLVQTVADLDPEFVLKVALYLRDDLNIRTTANFLIALAADHPKASKFLRKYFGKSVRLPSDWLDIAGLHLKASKKRALSASLRKAMVAKFPDFDVYQLGKYNRENALKRKKRNFKKALLNNKQPKPLENKLTIKQMVRQLHISKPTSNVMAILGKRYPSNEFDFWRSGIPGLFDPSRSGKRIKLPVPETWETLLAAKGNCAEAWEELIDNRKLPFMAMIRNLRNLLLTGVSPRHHNWVISRLNDKTTIANSRQFPFSFFSAFEALEIDLEELKKQVEGAGEGGASAKFGASNTTNKASGDKNQRKNKRVVIPKFFPTTELIDRYKVALDRAISLATIHNVKPIKGNTMVFVSATTEMVESDLSGRKIGRVKTLSQIGILLGLMCRYMCEDCSFLLFNKETVVVAQLTDNSILENMKVVSDKITSSRQENVPTDFLVNAIREKIMINNVIFIGNKEYLSTCTLLADLVDKYRKEVNDSMLFVNINLARQPSSKVAEEPAHDRSLYHPNNVCVSGFSDAILRFIAEKGEGGQMQYIQNIDIEKGIAGSNSNEFSFSKQGNSSLSSALAAAAAAKKKKGHSFLDPIQHCPHDGCDEKMQRQKIEEHVTVCLYRPIQCSFCSNTIAFNQSESHNRRCLFSPRLPMTLQAGGVASRATVNLFVSSTFQDMHGERDALNRFVFPEIRARAKQAGIDFRYVDLRWGISQEETASNVELCLLQVDKCRPFFLGILGERYGWVPTTYQFSDDSLSWLTNFPSGRSITELEMHYGALMCPQNSRALFFRRHTSFSLVVPPEFLPAFQSSPAEQRKLQDLTERIKVAGYDMVDYYAKWGGVVDSKPMATDLSCFISDSTEKIWQMICLEFELDPSEPPVSYKSSSTWFEMEQKMQQQQHAAFQEDRAHSFIGRKDTIKNLIEYADSDAVQPLIIHGSPGTGLSSLLAKFSVDYSLSRLGAFVISHFISSVTHSTSIHDLLRRLCQELHNQLVGIEELNDVMDPSSDYQQLSQMLPGLLKQASTISPVLIIVDAVNQLSVSSKQQLTEWIPTLLPSTAKLVLSMHSASETHQALQHRNPSPVFLEVAPLTATESREMIRKTLWEYRKRLDETPSNNQMRMVLRKHDSCLPAYIATLCDELRLFGLYEQLNDFIKSIPPSLPALLAFMLRRLEKDYEASVVRTALSLLWCSREGLTESDILILTARKNEKQLPLAVWAPISRALQSFLFKKSPHLLGFTNSQVRLAVEKRYLSSSGEVVKAHRQLAKFFLAKADSRADLSFQPVEDNDDEETVRAIADLPYHLQQGQMWETLASILTSLEFVETKCHQGMAIELINDLSDALNQPEVGELDVQMRGAVHHFYRFLINNGGVISQRPQLFLQQALNQPDFSQPSVLAKRRLQQDSKIQPNNFLLSWINKPQRFDSCVLTIPNYGDAVLSCAFSPDGRKMAISTKDRRIRLFDVSSGSETATLKGHTNAVVGCSFSACGSQLASASWDGTVRVWNVELGSQMQQLSSHTRKVSGCVFAHHNDQLLASASWDFTVRLWNSKSGKEILTFSHHKKPVNRVVFAPDDQLLASAAWDGTIIIWNLEGKPMYSIDGQCQSIKGLAFSPNGKMIVTTSTDRSIKLWNLEKGDLEHLFEQCHEQSVNSCVFSADGKHLITAADDEKIIVWDVPGGHSKSQLHTSHPELLFAVCCRSKNLKTGRLLFFAANDCKLYVKSENGTQVCLGEHKRTILSLDINENLLCSASEDGVVQVWEISAAAEGSVELLHTLNHPEAVYCVRFNPSEPNQLLCGCGNSTAYLWSDIRKAEPVKEPLIHHCHNAAILAVAFDRSGNLLTAGKDSVIKLWSKDFSHELLAFEGHRDWVTCLSVTLDGDFLASGSAECNGKLWDLRSGRLITTLFGHSSALTALEWSQLDDPSQVRLLSLDSDGRALVWDIQGQLQSSFLAHTKKANDVQWMEEDEFVTCGEDGSFQVVTTRPGSTAASFTGHSKAVHTVALSPSQLQIISASDDCTLKLWECDLQAITNSRPQGHERAVCSVSSCSVTGSVFSAGSDGLVRQWECRGGEKNALDQQLSIEKEEVEGFSVPSLHSRTLVSMNDRIESTSTTAQPQQTEKVLEVKQVGEKKVGRPVIAATSNSGAWLAIADYFGNVSVESSRKTVKASLKYNVRACAFNTEETMLYAAGWSSLIDQIGLTSKGPSPLAGHEDWVSCLSTMPYDDRLLSGGLDGKVLLWDTRRQLQISSNLLDSWVLCCAVSEKQRIVAAGTLAGKVSLMDVRSMSQFAAVNHSSRINGVAFSWDGSSLITAAEDRVVQLWDQRQLASPLTTFITKGGSRCVSAFRDQDTGEQLVAIGDSAGIVYLLQLMKI